MPKRFTAVWGEAGPDRPPSRPAVASALSDAESGDAPPSARQALWALKVMLERGHVSEEDYRRRRAAILEKSRAGRLDE